MESDTAGELEPQLATIKAGVSSTWLPPPLLNDVCYSCLAAIVQTQLAMLGLDYFFQLGPLYFGLGFLDLLLFLLPGPSGILRTMTLIGRPS